MKHINKVRKYTIWTTKVFLFLTLGQLFLTDQSYAYLNQCKASFYANKGKSPSKADGFLAHRTRKTETYRPSDPLPFAEIIPRLNDWSVQGEVRGQQARVVIHSKLDQVEMSGQHKTNASPAEFVMKLKKPFQTSELQKHRDSNGQLREYVYKDFWAQDVGRGLKLQLQSLEGAAVVEVELRGYAKVTGEPFVASTLINTSKLKKSISIPWAQFLHKNNVFATIIDSIHTDTNPETGLTEVPLAKGSRRKIIKTPSLFPYGKAETEVYEFKKNSALIAELFATTEIRFKVHPSIDSTKMDYRLKLSGSVHRDFNVKWLGEQGWQFIFVHALHLPGQGLGGITQFMSQKLLDRKAQAYALDIISKGHDAIENELRRYGFGMIEMPEKLTADEFFMHFSSYHPLRQGQNYFSMVPIEMGTFADYHGRYTHAAQILCLIHNESPESLKGIHTLSQALFGASENNTWRNIWNIFFDAPGADGPNAPLWWAKQFKNLRQ